MKIIFAIVFCFSAQIALGQDASPSSWKTLSKISYKKEYDELLGFKVDKPVFSPQVKRLEGKTIELLGYIIPTEGYKNHTE